MLETTIEGAPGRAGMKAEAWRSLATRRIVFGHQSVGGNVLAGVSELRASEGGPDLVVRPVQGGAEVTGAGLHHFAVGRNGEPESKIAAFAAAVESAPPGPLTALMKFCYVDVVAGTDPVALFERYRSTVDALEASRPDLTIVHVTMPLTRDPGGFAHLKALVRRLTTHRELNAVRARYNELLRAAYAERAPIFDLAELESTDAAGNAVAVRYSGANVPVMAPGWTDDGGHLNEAGRRRAAAAFLATLASL